ncbi:MAG: cadmium-translocating P-type ATPase [Armatimonadetes bacterium]|nr:cadmium-translocating P-type ATPase [Armatimonadota bacterium]
MSIHSVARGQKTLQLEIPLVLPGVDSPDDGCIGRIEERLRGHNGIASAHLDQSGAKPLLCLHYDPNLVPLEKLERLAREEGAQITRRFHHQTLPVRGMDCASCAASVEHVVGKVAGVTHVAVNYASAKMKVEFDSSQTTPQAIAQAVTRLGYRVPLEKEPAHPHAAREGKNWLSSHLQLAISLSSGAFLALGFFGEQFFGLPPSVALAFYLLAYLAGGYDLARHAIPTILSGRFDVEFLMLAGAVGAAILGNWAEGAFLLFLFSLGHALEGYALDRARGAIAALGNLSPKTARVRRDGGEIEIPVEELRVGDLAIVRSGDRVAVDGLIRSGASSLDQSNITGESVPVEKTVGEGVFAGSLNGQGALEVEVTRLSHDTTLARVVQMVEAAQGQKAASQTFAERFERIFVPAVLGIVVLAAIVPPLLGILTWEVAFLRAISTLVAASPCALALATPAAVLAGIARAARGGVLIKGGVHLENLGQVRAFAFDKTGTLTRGRPEIASVFALNGDENEILRLAASLEAHSSHPLANAVTRRAQELHIAFSPAFNEQNWPGRGVCGEIGGQTVRLGNARLFEDAGIAIPAEIEAEIIQASEMGQPTMVLGVESQILGLIALADPIRDQTPAALRQLRELGAKNLVMLTGDNARVAAKMAESAGISEFRADLLPEHKVAVVRELMEQNGAVAMVGDGVNDAPALAAATVGIAMGAGGSDVALETADVALMGDDLNRLPFAVALSRQSRAIVRQNLWLSLGVIAVLVPSTLFGFARLGVAVAFHEGSTILVCLNALRLLRFRFEPQKQKL